MDDKEIQAWLDMALSTHRDNMVLAADMMKQSEYYRQMHDALWSHVMSWAISNLMSSVRSPAARTRKEATIGRSEHDWHLGYIALHVEYEGVDIRFDHQMVYVDGIIIQHYESPADWSIAGAEFEIPLWSTDYTDIVKKSCDVLWSTKDMLYNFLSQL